ncbi:MAG: response regulator [bacterium]|nr:response regulator [bacterium]
MVEKKEDMGAKTTALICFVFALLTAISSVGLQANTVEKHMNFDHLSLEEGLSQVTVTCILQDRDGFMWFGTQDGLNRFDGYSFKVYRGTPGAESGFKGKLINGIFQDSRGTIWVSTHGKGVNRLDPATGLITNYRNPSKTVVGTPSRGQEALSVLSGNTVYDIVEDAKGNIWFGTYGNGLDRLDPKTGKITNYPAQSGNNGGGNGPSGNYILSLYSDVNGDIWVGTRFGLDKIEAATVRFTHYRPAGSAAEQEPPAHISAVCADHAGNILLGDNAGRLKQVNRQTGTYSDIQPGLPGNTSRIRTIYRERSGVLWICADDNGLYRMDTKKNISHYVFEPGNDRGLNSNFTSCVYQDRTDVLWVGTNNSGLNKCNSATGGFEYYFHNPSNPNSLSSKDITSLTEDAQGVLWIGTSYGLNSYDPATGTYRRYFKQPGNPRSLSHNFVFGVFADSRGRLWVSTRHGLNRFEPGTETFIHYFHSPDKADSISSNAVLGITESRTGDLWIGSVNGFNRFNPETGTAQVYSFTPGNPVGLSHRITYNAYEDTDGVLWVGTPNGLNRLPPPYTSFDVFVHDPANPGSICNNDCSSIYRDTRGTLWIGTTGGLNKYNPKSNSFTHYNQDHGLKGNIANGIREDDNGHLWLVGNDGLFDFDPIAETFTRYDKTDGLQDNEFINSAFYKSRDGKLYFGGINGLTAFYPKNVKRNTRPPAVLITGFQKFNKEVPTEVPISHATQLILDHNDYVFSFEFTALDFTAPSKNQFAYRMKNFDKDWLYADSDRRFATYTNLSPGDYVFQVKASNNHGVWNHSGTSIKIRIIPPLHRTVWFKLLLIIPFALGIFLFFRMRMKSIKVQRRKLEQLVNERTSDLEAKGEELQRERRSADEANRSKSDFLARMSHEIRTPMNAVIGFAEMLQDTDLNDEQLDFVRTINRSGESLVTLINDIVDFSKIESGQLTLEKIDFDPEVMAFDVCELMRPRIGHKQVEIICRIGDKVPSNIKGDPGRYRQVLINLLGNAVKFTKKGEIVLLIDMKDEDTKSITLHASVKDSGVGIPQEKLDTIFECFRQVDDSVTRRFGGSGLGLAICRQISRMMDGNVWAEAPKGGGSIFHFTARMEKSGKKPVKRITPESLAGKKILVVDDNKNNLDILAHLLAAADMEVVTLTRGEDVLPILLIAIKTRSPFDLCILDIHMPGLSGYEVARQIRHDDSPSPDLPLLAFTSSYSRRSKGFIESGFDGFLPKPVQRNKLISMLEQLLGESKHQKKKKDRKELSTQHSVVDKAKQSTRILLAEDNPVNRKLATFLLIKAGYNVETVENGKDAVDVFTANPQDYDMIFMDVQMPLMDGKTAASTIRERGFDIPIIAMTAQAMKGDREKCIESGMNDYVSKPIKREAVFDMVRKWTFFKKGGKPPDLKE